ncbi:hypothetical protein C1646_773376 [Rhizophagus diaphanus]|nr:hypothetical protein C1646_773376 [Rhizophagus diaphanus] [Rhizophagus sp. MUCL 43196]
MSTNLRLNDITNTRRSRPNSTLPKIMDIFKRVFFFELFDPSLMIRDIQKRSCWQAMKDDGVTDGKIIKEHIGKYRGHFDEIIRKDVLSEPRRLQWTKPNNNTIINKLLEDNVAGLTDSGKDKVEHFNDLNKDFSSRIKEVNGNQDVLKDVKVKESDDSEVLNGNKNAL